MRRFSDDMIMVGLPEDQWLADTKVRDGNIVAYVTEGANQGKHKLFNGQNTFAQLSYVEDGGGGIGSSAWGGITGTLSNQTDLQTALDGKEQVAVKITRSDAETGPSSTDVYANLREIVLTDTNERYIADGSRQTSAIVALFNTQSGTTYSTQSTDIGKTIWCTNSGAVTVTMNHANVRVVQAGTGQVTVVGGSGITLALPAPILAARTYSQYSVLEVLPTPTSTTFLVCGQLEA